MTTEPSKTANENGHELLRWLCNEIDYLEKTQRTEYGDGRLSAFKRVREAIVNEKRRCA